jgi:hypothetical protein
LRCYYSYRNSKIPRLLWSPKIHHRDKKSPPMDTILNTLSPVDILKAYLFRCILLLSSHRCILIVLGISNSFPAYHRLRICSDFFCIHYVLYSCPSYYLSLNGPNNTYEPSRYSVFSSLTLLLAYLDIGALSRSEEVEEMMERSLNRH